MRIALFLFILTPIIEMWLLIKVGGVIGALPTIGLVLLTACIGLALLRHQGREALLRARTKLQSQQMPVREMADGLFFAIGGALLLTPGFVTDAIGFACLTPGIRTVVIGFLSKHLLKSVYIHQPAYHQERHQEHYEEGRASAQNQPRNNVIDGDYERHSD